MEGSERSRGRRKMEKERERERVEREDQRGGEVGAPREGNCDRIVLNERTVLIADNRGTISARFVRKRRARVIGES